MVKVTFYEGISFKYLPLLPLLVLGPALGSACLFATGFLELLRNLHRYSDIFDPFLSSFWHW